MRREKKSESLEVRLSHSQKSDFMEICRQRGTTASDAVRGFISGVIDDAARAAEEEKAPSRLKELSMTFKNNPRKTLGAGVGAFGALALFAGTPSLADDDVFGRLDKNADGQITAEEISPDEGDGRKAAMQMVAALDLDDDGQLSKSEFHTPTGCVVRREDKIEDKNGEQTRYVAIQYTAFDLSDPEIHKISVTTGELTFDGGESDDAIETRVTDMQDQLVASLRDETGNPQLCLPKEGGKKIKKEIRKEIEKSLEE